MTVGNKEMLGERLFAHDHLVVVHHVEEHAALAKQTTASLRCPRQFDELRSCRASENHAHKYQHDQPRATMMCLHPGAHEQLIATGCSLLQQAIYIDSCSQEPRWRYFEDLSIGTFAVSQHSHKTTV